MIRVDLRTSLALGDTSAYRGLITWFEGTLVLDDGDSGGETPVGVITMAIVHVNEIRRRGERLADVLAADSSELEAIYEAYFEGNEDEETSARDFMYIADTSIAELYDRGVLDRLVVDLLRTSLASACGLVFIPYASSAERSYWSKLDFLAVTPGAREGLLYWPNRKLDTLQKDPKRRKPPKPHADKAARRH